MISTINTAHVKQDIPLVTFQNIMDSQHTDTNFIYANYAGIPAYAQAAYPHRHDFYEILYITGGDGTHFIDFNAYPITAGTVYFISPGQVHYWNTSVPLEAEGFGFRDGLRLKHPTRYNLIIDIQKINRCTS